MKISTKALFISLAITCALASIIILMNYPMKPFNAGVSFGLFVMAYTAMRTGMASAQQKSAAPVLERPIRGFRSWLITPRRYPNGSSFAPMDHALYGTGAVASLALSVWLLGWAFQALSVFFAGR